MFSYLPSLPIVDLFTSGLFRVQILVKVCLLRFLYARRRKYLKTFLFTVIQHLALFYF